MRVRSNLEPNRVAFWERHPAHIGGEVFIADDQVHEVGETAAVRAAVREGRLMEVQDDGGSQTADRQDDSRPQTADRQNDRRSKRHGK